MSDLLKLFPNSYETSRARFRANLSKIQALWPDARLESHHLRGDEDVSIDWITAEALDRPEKRFILTTGEHGIEGYVGSAMQMRFIEAFMPGFDPADTGLVLVHAINPWGMKHHKRTNANNVDLNRNFVYCGDFDPNYNADYARIEPFICPPRPLRNFILSSLKFLARVGMYMIRPGYLAMRHMSLLGQYRYPHGLHYGGEGYQEETQTLMGLYRDSIRGYAQILHLDMHTGYGPRYQMSLVNSAHEPRRSQEFVQRFDYPLVVAANPEEFYAIKGDMVDYIYELFQNEFPEKRFFASALEFGTFGAANTANMRGLRAMILENRVRWYGAANDALRQKVQTEFDEMFYPEEEKWRLKALEDGERAFRGILQAEGFIEADYRAAGRALAP